MRYVLFVIDDKSNTGTGEEMAAIDHFNQMLIQESRLEIAVGIAGPAEAKIIDNRSGKALQELGSLNTSPHYSGFWLLTADDQSHAEELALSASMACNRKIELRPLLGQNQ